MIPAVTALIPTHNRPDCVERLIQSIHAQEFHEAIEFIVVDDGSVPPIQIDNVMLIRNQTRMGACITRNRGFAAARGEFILLLDDDTQFSDPTTLQRAVELARRHGDFGAVGFRQLMSNGVPHDCQPAPSEENCETAYFFGYGVLLRRAAVQQTKGFEESFDYGYEEQDLCLQLHQAGWRVMYAPQLKLLHHNDPRGRNWTRIHRLISRNAIRSILLRFPILMVVPCAVLKWLSFFVESRRRGKVDWSGSFQMLLDTLKFVPYAVRNRCPMPARILARYARLKNTPLPLGLDPVASAAC
jgi:GT2 family glycosyltransferase